MYLPAFVPITESFYVAEIFSRAEQRFATNVRLILSIQSAVCNLFLLKIRLTLML